MGQYLSMGLVTEISVSRNKLEKGKISKDELKNKIEKSLLYDMSLYDESEREDSIAYILKDEVIEKGLLPLLEELYPVIYKDDDSSDYLKVLDALQKTPSSDKQIILADEWINLAYDNEFYSYRIDEYGESEYLSFEDKDFRPTLCLNFEIISLYMSHGKISTEGVGNFFDFFKYCVVKAFKEHPIAKSLRVYITG